MRHSFQLTGGHGSRQRALRVKVVFDRRRNAGRIAACLLSRTGLVPSLSVFCSGLLLVLAAPANAASNVAPDGPEYVVLPYTCAFKSGKVRLAPSRAQAYEVVGSRSERPFTACTTTGNRDCFTMMLHSFDVACDGRRVPWHLMVSHLRGAAFGSSKIVDDQLQLVLKDAKVKVASGAAAKAGFGNSKRFVLPVGYAPVGEVGARLVFSGAGGEDAGPQIVPIGDEAGNSQAPAGLSRPVLTRVGSVEAVENGSGWVTSVNASSGEAELSPAAETTALSSQATRDHSGHGGGHGWFILASVMGVLGLAGFALMRSARRFGWQLPWGLFPALFQERLATGSTVAGEAPEYADDAQEESGSAGLGRRSGLGGLVGFGGRSLGAGRRVAGGLALRGWRFAGGLSRVIRLPVNTMRLPWRATGLDAARRSGGGQRAGEFSDIAERWSDHPLLAGGVRMLVKRMEVCVRTIERLEPHCAVRETLEHELQDVRSRLEVSRLGLREETGLDEEAFARRGSSMMRAAIRDLERIEKIARSAGVSQSMVRNSAVAGSWGGEATGSSAMGEFERAVGDPAMTAMPSTKAEAYRVLGVNANVSDAALKKVVDALRMSWHPDLAGDDEADRELRETRIRQINLAWDLIKADEARAVA